MLRMSGWRRAVIFLTAFVLLAAIAYAGFWQHMASQLRAQLEPWVKERANEGYSIRWDSAAVRGFPGFFRYDFVNLTFGTLRPLPLVVEAPTASAWTLPWDFKHWHFAAPSGARLLDSDGLAGLEVVQLDGMIDIGNRAATLIDLTALHLNGIGIAKGVRIGDAQGHLEVPNRRPQTHNDPALALSLQLGEATLPGAVPGFGNTLPGFAFAAQMKGALPPGPLVKALERWRDDGGTIELQSLRLRWSSLLIDASGTVALDEMLQPEGALSAVITGQDAAVDVAIMTGALKRDQASAAQAVLSMLSPPPGSQGDKAVTLPITVQSHQLYVGPAKITNLPAIRWQ